MTTSEKTESPGGPADTALLAAACLVVLAAVSAYYLYDGIPIVLRTLGILVGVGIGAALFYRTYRGRQLWHFIQGSRVEIRKVIWPTRQETLQTTLTVVFFVLVFGVFFWLLDLLLLFLSRTLTGQGG